MMMPTLRCGNRSSKVRRLGTTAVEFAVVAPVFFLFVFAILEFGRTLMVMELLNEAARVGCRRGIIAGTKTSDIKGEAVDFLSSVGIGGESVQVTINDNQGNVTEAADVPNYTEITVGVSVKVKQISWVSWWMYPNPNATLSGQWTLRRE